MKNINYFLIGVIPLQWLALKWSKNNSEWIETNYSQKFYPLIFKSYRSFFENINFSFGDLIYLAAIIYFIGSLIYLFKNPLNRFQNYLYQGLTYVSLIHLIFQLSWGLNYYRLPLNKALAYDLTYNEAQLTETLEKLIQTTNLLHEQLSNEDSLPVKIPYSKDTISSMIERDFLFMKERFSIQPFIKNSLWSSVLSYMGYSGYLNPLTLESHVNKNIPAFNYITTAAHEMAHQLGIAAENEANFIAFFTTINNPDPFIKFSGYSFGLKYCYADLYKLNQKKAIELIAKLKPGILKNFQEQSAFWKAYENPFEPYLKKGYDKYLKANGQVLGIQSYNAMVALVIAYSKENIFEI